LNPGQSLNRKGILGELVERRSLITALESYLMAHRGESTYQEFIDNVEQLVVETLAYALADDGQKAALVYLFTSVAQYIERREPDALRQVVFSKTLLGVETAQNIEAWTVANSERLLETESNDGFINIVWDMLKEQLDDKFSLTVEPNNLPLELAKMWMSGCPYQVLFTISVLVGGTKPWGDGRSKLTDDNIISFCESTLGFEFPLGIAAVTQFLFGGDASPNGPAAHLLHFQKSLKYGIDDELAISCYENGFADRMLAQKMAETLRNNGFPGTSFMPALDEHRDALRFILSDYPSYFESVLETIA
jgi:hypothetical protein